jgi:hypothetical protein
VKLNETPRLPVERIIVTEATELDIQAAIVVLRARAVRYGLPIEVKAFPHNPKEGWKQAALSFIRKNREEAAKGNGILI